MSNCGPCVPCAPVQFCQPENFGLAFPSLVGPDGPPGGPGLYVENYGALRALDPTTYPAGYVANVGGYDSVNDGGQGQFVYVPTGTDADNDGTILTPSNNVGRWYRMFSGPINVMWFGAVGDGVANDYQSIQNAITYIESLATGGEIYVPVGTYLIGSSLSITGLTNLHFFGAGWGPTGTTLIADSNINILEMGSGSADRTVDIRIEHMLLDGADTAEIGIVVNRLHHILLNRVRIQNFTVAGVDMNMAYNNELRDLYIDACERGIIVDENNEYTLIFRCKIFNCTEIGIHFRNGSCSGSQIQFCDIEANVIGIQVDCGSVENVEGFGVVGCYFKDQEEANALFGTDASSLFIDSLLFQNNEIKAGTAGPATNTVEMNRCRKPVAISNHFTASDFVTGADIEDLVEFGNTFASAATEPTLVQLGNSGTGGNLRASLPSSDPGVPEELFENSGVVEVSL